MFESLIRPQWPQARHWLNLFENERPPRILWSSPSDEVTWSSTWTHHPEVEIRFGLSPRNCGTSVRVELHAPEPVPSEASIGHLRKRILELIFRDLQYSYGS